jgi:uracil-DNA glycosylase
MLNSVLTVQAHKAGSHAEHGWETYTDAVLRLLNEQQRPIVYMLWGNYAKNKAQFLNNSKQLVLKAAHPSPFSASSGFFGCGHFKKCNEFLEANGIQPIDWQIKDI